MPPTLDLTDAATRPVRFTSPVRKLQGLLIAHGYPLGVPGVDGVAGRATRQAVVSFQSSHHLRVDAVVGPVTWAALIES